MPLALLHAGGWDELILVGIALIVGVGIVYFTGRKRPDELEDEPAEPAAEPSDQPVTPDEPAQTRDSV